ncbi:hypothetical protein ACJ73_08967, partial [Blastomyces percursus]
MPTLPSHPDAGEQRLRGPWSSSPAPAPENVSSNENNDAQQEMPQQTPQTTHYQKKDDWPPERLANLYMLRLQNSKMNWDEFQDTFYPNYHTQVRFKFYEARKLAAKNALQNISPVHLPSNMQPRSRKPRHTIAKFYGESEVDDSDTDSEGGDIMYQTENTSAGPDIASASHTLASKPKPKPEPKPKPISTPSARRGAGSTPASTGTRSGTRPTKRPRISTTSRPATPSTGADTTTIDAITTVNRTRKPVSTPSHTRLHGLHAPAHILPSTTPAPAPAPASVPALTLAPATATTTATATASTPTSEFGSKIRFDRLNLTDWTYIYHLARACPAERERADALALRDREQLRTIAEMRSRMAEMEAEMGEMKRQVEMREAEAAAAAAAAAELRMERGAKQEQEQEQEGKGQADPSSSLSSLLGPHHGDNGGHDEGPTATPPSPSTIAAAATQVSTALKTRTAQLTTLFDGLWKASLKFIPPFQLEEMGMQRGCEAVVGKIGEIEGAAEGLGSWL